MGWHPLESLMKTTMDSLKAMVDVNTVVGEPVETKEGTVIIPVSRVSFGFVTGGGDDATGMEQGGGSGRSGGTSGGGGKAGGPGGSGGGEDGSADSPLPFTGGTGAGVTVRPVGFLVVSAQKVRFLPVDSRALFDRLLDEVPELLERLKERCGHRGVGGSAEDDRYRPGPADRR